MYLCIFASDKDGIYAEKYAARTIEAQKKLILNWNRLL